MERMRYITTSLLGIVLFITCSLAVPPDYVCGPGLVTPGTTVPKGDIIVEYGNPLEILCILSPEYLSKGRNASHLEFTKLGNTIPKEYVTILNETTLRFYDPKPFPSRNMYYCKLKADPQHNLLEESVCLNSVAVGFKPQEVQNFSCVSYNWDNLTCTWNPPQNFVKTEYRLYFYMPPSRLTKFPCPINSDVLKHICFWDQRTTVVYRQPYLQYKFLMFGTNKLGNITQKFNFQHYANVIPSRAENLTILEKTTNSALIQWSIVFPMQNFPPGVIQKVEYQSRWDSRDHWQVVDTSHLNKKNETHRLNITDLKYANCVYDIRVFMRSAANLPGEEKWSQPATITVKTKDKIPGAAPKTVIGSFEISANLNSRDVYLYWQQIPEYLYNSESFGYKVIEILENDVPRNITPNEITKTYAVFKGLTLNKYVFKIASVNRKGLSETSSEIYVPAQIDYIPEPISFTKIAFKSSIYELSWKPPLKSSKIDSYTIFWCDNKMDRPYPCTGFLNWTIVPKNETIKNITVSEDKIYQFAISANSLAESSGMVWASCTVIHDRGVGKMKSFWINRIGARFIELGWKLECSDRIGVVTGFRVYYCPIIGPRNMSCKGDLMNTTIHGDSNTIHGNITDLIPYSTYKVAIIVLTKSGGQGQPSDYQFNTTLEAAPDFPPQNVQVSQVKNTSLVVSWQPPQSMNGVLRFYQIHYNDKIFNFEGNKSSINVKAELVNLNSFTNYSLSVSACTISCSIKSEPVYVRTGIGRPGIMEAPSVKFNNFSIVLFWKPPDIRSGYIDYYEVMVEQYDDKQNTSIHIYNSTDTQKQIEDCKTEHSSRTRTYRVSVRAVNCDKNVTLPGPWSSVGEGSCFVTGPSRIVLVIIWGFAILILSLIMVYISKRVWRRCKEMQNVEVALPPGLVSNIEKEKDQEYHVQMHWPKTQKTETEHRSQNSADQELLLQKKGKHPREIENDQSSIEERDGEGDGDSSGCSSGHDSVSSSLSSGTHVSSDSGTEADQCIPPDGLFNDADTPISSLRQRITTTATPNTTSITQWHNNEPYVMLGTSNTSLSQTDQNTINREESSLPFLGYCRVGGNPTKPGSALGYITLSDSSPPQATSGYVSHLPYWEEIKDPSTVAPSPPVPAKGYVMAGDIDPSTPYCRLGCAQAFNDYVPHNQFDFNL